MSNRHFSTSNTHKIQKQPDVGSIFNQLRKSVLDLLFPTRCVNCRSTVTNGKMLCAECTSKISLLTPPWCNRCGQPGETGQVCSSCASHAVSLTNVRSAVIFDGPVRSAVHALKYANAQEMAKELAELMARQWKIIGWPVDVIIPVPLHRTREKERGFNQSSLLAHAISREVGAPVEASWVERTRKTTPQVTLNAQERRQNVANAFSVNKLLNNLIAGKKFLLVDDVCTTGATLSACAEALHSAGATSVQAFTLARARWDAGRASDMFVSGAQ